MQSNISKGKKGEDIACQFLINSGYIILDRNYRYQHAEIDIICRIDDTLIFTEVKLRHSDLFGYPEESVTLRKEVMIRLAADHYIFELNWMKDIRFDIISVEYKNKNPLITHFKDVF